MKFQLADDRRKSTAQRDDPGVVVVSITLCYSGHRPVKGNIVRKIRLENCRVGEVYEAILAELVE